MPPKLQKAAPSGQPAPADPAPSDWSARADLDQWLDRVRRSLQDTGWTPDALAAFWEIDRGYVWKLLSGEKPWSVARTLALPPVVLFRLAFLEADHRGLLVFEPVDEATADQYIAIGTLSKLRHVSPAKSGVQAKAQLRSDLAKELAG